jgi:hypothetical protein
MRKLGAAPDYMLGSAAAVTDDGEILVASGSGSQLGAYAYAAGKLVLVVGHQKLVRDVDEGLRRLREYSLPREYERMQSLGHPGSALGKTLILHQELSGRTRVILVPGDARPLTEPDQVWALSQEGRRLASRTALRAALPLADPSLTPPTSWASARAP